MNNSVAAGSLRGEGTNGLGEQRHSAPSLIEA